MWICPVCKTENYNLICSDCGFDESQNYDKYPSLIPLSPEMIDRVQKQWWSDKDLLSERFPAAFSEIMSAKDFDSLLKSINIKSPFQSGKYQINSQVVMLYDMEKKHYELSDLVTEEKLIFENMNKISWTVVFGRYPRKEDGDTLLGIIKKQLTDNGKKDLKNYERKERSFNFKKYSFVVDGWNYILSFPADTAGEGRFWKLRKYKFIETSAADKDPFKNDNFWSVPKDNLKDKFGGADTKFHEEDISKDIFDHAFSEEKARFWKFKVDDVKPDIEDVKDSSDVKLKGMDFGESTKYKNIKGVYYCTDCGSQLESICSDGFLCKHCSKFFTVNAKNTVEEVTEDTKHPFFSLIYESDQYRKANMWNKEIAVLRKAMKKFGISSFIMIKMGRAYRHLGNFAKAMECYRRALSISPEDGLVYCNMGVLCYAQGNYETAIYYYKQAMRYMSDQDAEFSTFLANYALALGTVGSKEQAVFMLNRAESLGYQNADIIRNKLGI